jgi:hypothetical protein
LLVLVSSHPSFYLIPHKIQVSFSATSEVVPFPRPFMRQLLAVVSTN